MAKIIPHLMAVLLLVALVESAVTVYNPARLQVNVLVDDKNVKMETDTMSFDLTRGEQNMNFTTGQGDQVMSISVKDGDVLVLIPERLSGSASTPVVQLVEIPGDTGSSFVP